MSTLLHGHFVLLEEGYNFKIDGLKLTWGQLCYWSPIKNLLTREFCSSLDYGYLCIADRARISMAVCIYVGLKMDMLPLRVFLCISFGFVLLSCGKAFYL